MLTDKEIQFLCRWERDRKTENTIAGKISKGLPIALLFSLPILLLMIIVRLFFPDWYMKISGMSSGTFITAIFAIFGIILFYSFFRMQYKWEMNEQLYNELKQKESKPVSTFQHNN